MEFQKYHGLGNDYIVLDPATSDFEPSPEAIRAVCDRNYGVGSDGILYGPLPGAGAHALRIFNPDGSEAEKSGNGLRIFSWYLYEKGYVGPSFPVDTPGGRVRSEIVDAASKLVRVDMGPPRFDSVSVGVATPLAEFFGQDLLVEGHGYRAHCVTMGNPHCVIMGSEVTAEAAKRLGPKIERHALFPNRINVQLLEVLSRSEIHIEIWERGAGYTLASGSSSCGAASVARRLGLVDDEVTVRMPGGALEISFAGGTVHMTGPVEKVCEGSLCDGLRARMGGRR